MYFYFYFHFFGLLEATPMVYGNYQAKSQCRAVASKLHNSHSNGGSEQHLQAMPQLMAMPDL